MELTVWERAKSLCPLLTSHACLYPMTNLSVVSVSQYGEKQHHNNTIRLIIFQQLTSQYGKCMQNHKKY